MQSTRSAMLAVVVAVLFALSAAWGATRTWDAGYQIGGMLDEKEIIIAASCEDGDSTDTIGWMGMDMDHYVDREESVPVAEGEDADDFGGFAETKCWWTCSDGIVTNGAFSTTWAAPYETGTEADIALGVVDLPKTIAPGEGGTRDDPGREEFEPAQPKKPKSIWITWWGRLWGTTNCDFDFNSDPLRNPCGVGILLEITTPYHLDHPDETTANCDGFWKKRELVGTMEPVIPGTHFVLEQKKKGYFRVNGVYQDNFPDWVEDNTASQDTADEQGRVFVWDAPGLTCRHWLKDPREVSLEFIRDYRNIAYLNGKRCSHVHFWDRNVVLAGGAGYWWNYPAAQND